MSIMPCYSDRRAIENELGGKWELFFEETRDEAGAVGLEWDKDIDDLPLNLNGVLILIEQDKVLAVTTLTLNVISAEETNRILTINNALSNIQGLVSWLGCRVENGLVMSFGKGRNTSSGVSTLATGVNPIFTDAIHYFNVTVSELTSGANIKVYVLRGV